MVDGGLLDRIAAAAGCEYFSDIKFNGNAQRVLSAAAAIPPEDYPLDTWSYALSYITERTLRFESAEELKAFLKEEMNRSGGEQSSGSNRIERGVYRA